MKRFSKFLLVLVVVALSLPMICNADTAMAKKAKKAKKLTAEQVLARMEEETAKQNSITAVSDTNLELTVLGALPISLKEKSTEDMVVKKDGSASIREHVVQNIKIDENLLSLISGGAANIPEETESTTYVYADETGISVYVNADGKWEKVILPMEKLMNAALGGNQTAAAGKKKEPVSLKMKESKKKYTITFSVKITKDMIDEIVASAADLEGVAQYADVIALVASDHAFKFTFVVDKKTMLMNTMKMDATEYTNDVLANVISYMAAKDPSIAPIDGKVAVKEAQTKATLKYGKVKSIKLPAEAENGEDHSEEAFKLYEEIMKKLQNAFQGA